MRVRLFVIERHCMPDTYNFRLNPMHGMVIHLSRNDNAWLTGPVRPLSDSTGGTFVRIQQISPQL